eukprot:508447-Alexandrium_andersonii.AAC.1
MLHRQDPDHPELINCPHGPAISETDLVVGMIYAYRNTKGGKGLDRDRMLQLRANYSGTGKGHTYDEYGEGPVNWVGGVESR